MPRSFSVHRKWMALAERGSTVESAARSLAISVKSIEKKAGQLGISIRDGLLSKRHSVRLVDLEVKATRP